MGGVSKTIKANALVALIKARGLKTARHAQQGKEKRSAKREQETLPDGTVRIKVGRWV